MTLPVRSRPGRRPKRTARQRASRYTISAMTVTQFCSLTDLSASQVTALREAGVISPDLPPDQAGRARLIQALKAKGIPLSRLAAADLAFDAGSASYAVYDGHQLRTCRDAVPAIGVAGEAPLL